MKLFLKKTENIYIPEAAYKDDKKPSVGYDIKAVEEPKIVGEKVSIYVNDNIHDNLEVYKSVQYIEYRTGLYIEPEYGKYIDVLPRSSISKYQLQYCNSLGVIDPNYTGEILIRLRYFFQPQDLFFFQGQVFGGVNPKAIYHKNDLIGQLVAREAIPIEFEIVENLSETQRNAGGFGSSTLK
jgi:dUTPase